MSPSEDAEEDGAQRIRRAIDELDAATPSPDRTRGRPTRAVELPEPVQRRIREAVDDVAYLQHAYATEHHHVCHVGVREEATIRESLVVAGPDGVVTIGEVEERVDELRAGAEPGRVAGATMEARAGTR